MIIRPKAPSTLSMLFSRHGSIIPFIWGKVLFTVLIALAVSVTHGTLYHFKVTLTATPFSLIGLTLAIFLGFRNSVCYDRFWEGRKLWGELLIVSRNLARQTLTLTPDIGEEGARNRLYRICAFGHALRHHLRDSDPREDLQRLLPAGELEVVMAAANRPNLILERLGRHQASLARSHDLPPVLLASMDEQITRMSYVLGGCERIRQTPMPYAYLLLLHRTVHMYCFMLPFGLIDTVGYLTPLVVAIVSYTFFALDALGEQIENPFDTHPNDLPLKAISHAIEGNLKELLGEAVPPAPPPDEDGILL
ncbi:bestrophin family protein [Paludibacterium paludis]|uniref:Bestrophin n=1 Tax=Paludibacterium paludis TaxID=1225769 RepID=A0A918P6X4_9NEIS|nr:bestrophin family ion channel [Paludibacterium paludis]GGY27930.1 hypothetical protein GCM10011289_34100 [Paludibacterium paludis]